jgi:Methyltransferase domain
MSNVKSKMTNPPEATACRLCRGATAFAHRILVLAKYDVSYYRCQKCGSLQTEYPYWLAESYSDAAASIDPGSARRVLDSYILVEMVARIFACRKLLDFGGNTGFLCRLLRDHGYDAYSFDRYVASIYAPHFLGRPSERHDLVTAFEVMEHFANPAVDLDQLFQARPKIVLATTELFSGQSAGWWYLAPREGQHVFFYSAIAARYIADQYGYHLYIGRGFLLFSELSITFVQGQIIRLFLRPRILRVLGAMLLMRRGKGADKDFAQLTQQNPAD